MTPGSWRGPRSSATNVVDAGEGLAGDVVLGLGDADHDTGGVGVVGVRSTPAGATIIDADGLTFSRGYGGWDMHGNEYTYADHEIDLPATLVVVDGI